MRANVAAVTLWRACRTQWRTDCGVFIGLDYTAMYKVAESLDITIRKLEFLGVNLIENLFLDLRRKEDQDGRSKNKDSRPG